MEIRTMDSLDPRRDEGNGISRRRFLQGAGATAAAFALSGGAMLDDAFADGEGEDKDKGEGKGEKGEIRNRQPGMRYRRLGRTGLLVSEIGFGTTRLDESNAELVLDAIDKGLNYIDTASGYGRGATEEALGGVLKGRRDLVFIATKASRIGRYSGKEAARFLERSAEQSLKKLRTDVLDVLMLHGVREAEQVMNPHVFKAFDGLKKKGKIRFCGLSCHSNIPETLAAALGTGRYDVMLASYNTGNAWAMDPVIKAVVKADVGFCAMKVAQQAAGERGRILKKLGKGANLTAHQLCYRWALENPGVSTALACIINSRHLKEDLAVPGKKLSWLQKQRLQGIGDRLRRENCAMCGRCDICPEGVEIAAVQRALMYHINYGDPKAGCELYGELSPAARGATCSDCGLCEDRCPNGIPIRRKLREAAAVFG
jgi:predicted aldo/keto reductase-like oxidoreductase